MSKTTPGPDGHLRCHWCSAAPDYLHYHDTEWGFPVADDQQLFEKLCLEGFQSGLSWRTILAKRSGFRAAFADFDFNKIAGFTDADVERMHCHMVGMSQPMASPGGTHDGHDDTSMAQCPVCMAIGGLHVWSLPTVPVVPQQ